MRSRSLSLTAVLLSASLLLAGCGGSDEEKDEPKADTPAVVEPQTWPLTGLEAEEGKDVALTRPVFVVKIDNSGKAGAQVGLSKADLVFEQMVEGRTTRLAAFFHSKAPGVVGPVRSMRASDIGIVSPVGAQIVTSGAAGQTIDRVRKAGITFHEEGAAGFYRESSRSAPYNLMANLKDLAKAEEIEATRPDDYFAWGTAADLPAGKPATSLRANFGNHTTAWSFSNGGWVNETSNAAQGDEFAATNVLVLRVKVRDAGYKDMAGSSVPESIYEGKGDATLFHDGKVIEGTWTKDGLDGAVTLEAGGKELKVPAGKTWVELLPAVDAELTFAP
ncbi:DUF3048 domain-containing protein [Nocardioides gilvus]|uniref:DUF3048 domain-containing protein n=1 Tax=Nocardioides gilvus TaxID=1735589 RepID=UPI0013A56C0A|nr:DUF3048 domain-containing protein [Nocardioides gilvus]